MISLIYGGSRSGKSTYGEKIIEEYNNKLYIATMEPFDDECVKQIKKHRQTRVGKGYETLECYTILPVKYPKSDAVILECLGNLCANELYKGFTKEDIWGSMLSLIHSFEEIVFISNDVFTDGIKYSAETDKYIETLAYIHKNLAYVANNVIECVCGIKIYHKGVANV